MDMNTEIDARFDDTGFVYVGNTRILYAARHLLEHTPEPATPDEILLANSSGGWDVASKTERAAALKALQEAFPTRAVVNE
jgi:hypothetical protein